MKRYAISLFLIICVGAGLSYLTFNQNKLFDEDVFLKTTASIRNLKIIDNTINILLFKMHYEDADNNGHLEELMINISEEFDNLRFEALFEEIESSETLEKETIKFEFSLSEKIENIERFVEYHQRLLNARETFSSYSENNSLFTDAINTLALNTVINNIYIDFYQFLLNSNTASKNRLNNNIGKVDTAIETAEDEVKELLYGYIFTLSEIILSTEEANNYFIQSVDQETADNLNTLELEYSNYHNRFIESSTHIRNALIIFGIVLLTLLLFLAYLLRKNYLGLEQEVTDRTEEIQQAYTDLKESQEQLIQSEKMASLGEMVAGVAHEINTPLGYVNSNIHTIQLNLHDTQEWLNTIELLYTEVRSKTRDSKKLSTLLAKTLHQFSDIKEDELFNESQQLLEDSHHGLSEISKLVMSLKDFSRLDRQSTAQVNIHDCIESSLNIGSNTIKSHKINIVKEFSDLPDIICTPSKLNQVFLNIINNAAHAMKEDGGTLTIKTQSKDDSIVILFNDEGVGMDESTQHKMFDPFFTSKPIGEGTGLGMSIAYKIIQSHKGNIKVKSTLNVGTSIAIQLPINASEQ